MKVIDLKREIRDKCGKSASNTYSMWLNFYYFLFQAIQCSVTKELTFVGISTMSLYAMWVCLEETTTQYS